MKYGIKVIFEMTYPNAFWSHIICLCIFICIFILNHLKKAKKKKNASVPNSR